MGLSYGHRMFNSGVGSRPKRGPRLDRRVINKSHTHQTLTMRSAFVLNLRRFVTFNPWTLQFGRCDRSLCDGSIQLREFNGLIYDYICAYA